MVSTLHLIKRWSAMQCWVRETLILATASLNFSPRQKVQCCQEPGKQRTFHTFSRRIGILFPSTTTIGKRMRLEGMNTRH